MGFDKLSPDLIFGDTVAPPADLLQPSSSNIDVIRLNHGLTDALQTVALQLCTPETATSAVGASRFRIDASKFLETIICVTIAAALWAVITRWVEALENLVLDRF